MIYHNMKRMFSTITHLRGKSQKVSTENVRLRGIHLGSSQQDSPTMIFFTQAFDQVQNWLPFFTHHTSKILQQRNIYILYARNFGNSDHSDSISWQQMANDVARFMYEHKISMATLAGHGIGAKVALAAACYHYDKITGVCSIDSTPMNQFYHSSAQQLRQYIKYISEINLSKSYPILSNELKHNILCPKWRKIFLNCLERIDSGYTWNFNMQLLKSNLMSNQPNSLWNWPTNIGLYPGRSLYIFPQFSRWVHLSTNTIPMHNVTPKMEGWNSDIFAIQGDQNPLNHWVYDHEEQINPYAWRMYEFLRHYDGVHGLIKNRQEVGSTYIPDISNARIPRQDIADQHIPPHYYHNWRFNNVYKKQ